MKIISGSCAGEMAFIPRIKLVLSEEFPFELHRVQFPVKFSFGMTINKSQGQSLGTVGLKICIIQCLDMGNFMWVCQEELIGGG